MTWKIEMEKCNECKAFREIHRIMHKYRLHDKDLNHALQDFPCYCEEVETYSESSEDSSGESNAYFEETSDDSSDESSNESGDESSNESGDEISDDSSEDSEDSE